MGKMIRAKNEHVSSILSILEETFPPESFESFKNEVSEALNESKRYDSQTNAWVYVQEGEVLGYICMRLWSRTYWWDTMAVAKKGQGKGIGSDLTQFVKDRCVADDVAQVNLWTYHKDIIKMYEKRGFILSGEVEGIFPPYDMTRFYLRWRNQKLFK